MGPAEYAGKEINDLRSRTVFNLLPMLPADGGHIAIFWFERARGWFYALLGKGDPGRVD